MKTRSPAAKSPDGARSRLVRSVESYFDHYPRPKRDAHVLVAVSGGPDSTALLAILKILAVRYRWILGVAHINHGLRGADSDGDEDFVRDLAIAMGLVFHTIRLEPKQRTGNINTQHWARRARYEFLEKTSDDSAYDHIAIAHHLDDRAETVAAAVLDGGSTFALSGIPPVRGRIIRPFFNAPRALIMEFLAESEVDFHVDASNLSTEYQRNRIRQKVLPSWEEENPRIVEGLALLGERLWEQRRYLEAQAVRILKRAVLAENGPTLSLDARRLRGYDYALDAFMLRDLAARVGFEDELRPATVSRFGELRHRPNGSGTVEQGRLVVKLSKGIMRVGTRSNIDGSRARFSPERQLDTREVGYNECPEHDDRQCARFDADSIRGPLVLRSPQPGDRYQPFGLSGSKKLADLLADRGVPAFDRPDVRIVADELGILWPVGHPIAHRARLTSHTRRVLEARVLEGSWKTS